MLCLRCFISEGMTYESSLDAASVDLSELTLKRTRTESSRTILATELHFPMDTQRYWLQVLWLADIPFTAIISSAGKVVPALKNAEYMIAPFRDQYS